MSHLNSTPPLSFYARDCLEVGPELVGKLLCRKNSDGTVRRLRILETEAYRGEEDTACHAHRGKTPRTLGLYGKPGTLYVYLCYGIHWMLNIITGEEGQPQGILIRSCEGAEGPGKLTKALGIDGRFHGKSILTEEELWLEDDGVSLPIVGAPRVGIGYASPEDQARPWRFVGKQEKHKK